MSRRKPLPLRARLLVLAGILALLGATYATGRAWFHRRFLLSTAQSLLSGFATVRVGKIGGAELSLQGDITLRDAEVYTERGGARRLFYRSREVVLSLDGIPRPGRRVRLMRVDLVEPEIFIRRERDGVWNVEWVFRPDRPPQPTTASARPGPPPEDGFPVNGIHFQRGIVHVTIVARSGREVTWTTTAVRGVIAKERGVLSLRSCDGNFYGGLLRASAEVPSTEPFVCDFQVSVTGTNVTVLAERLALSRPVTGTMDGVLALKRSPERTNSRPIAAGRVEIRDGDLWELPVFLSILSILGLDPGFDRRIDTAEVQFTVEEDRIRIDQMDFLGSPLCLFGDGEMDLAGENLEVVFIPRLGKRGLGDIIPILGTPVQWLLDVIKGALLPVVMTGSFYRPKLAVKPGYIIATPVRKLIERKSSK